MPRKFSPRDKKDKKDKKRMVQKRRACRFCVDKDMIIDYKMPRQLAQFLSERGKIVPRRITGNCAFHQRKVVLSVERARMLALMPYSISHALL